MPDTASLKFCELPLEDTSPSATVLDVPTQIKSRPISIKPHDIDCTPPPFTPPASETTVISQSACMATAPTTQSASPYQTKHPYDIIAPKANLNEWLVEAPPIGDWARKLYREYVGITDDEELKQHLMEIRADAWAIYQYRCVASFMFVNYNLSDTYGGDWYQSTILERLRNEGALFLDLACAFGHTARNLVFDGVNDAQIVSADLRREFWELGYKLFRDRDKFHGKFFQGDILDEEYLKEWEGKFDILHVSALFHLFNVEDQKKIMRRIINLLSKKPGSVFFGRAAGNTIPQYKINPIRSQGLYQHNEESFKEMFAETVRGEEWDVKVILRTDFHGRPDSVDEIGGKRGGLRFMITRL